MSVDTVAMSAKREKIVGDTAGTIASESELFAIDWMCIDTTGKSLTYIYHTLSSSSSAKGSTNRSPTEATEAFPSNKVFAALK